MKKKTWIKSIAVLLSVIIGVGAFVSCSGSKDCEHQVNKWSVVREATCTTEGLRRGPCILCGDILEESLPVEPDNHVYGDWEILSYPSTETSGTGKAVKKCAENSEHKLEVTLPRITDRGAGYLSSEITLPSTVLNEGERTLVYEHETGNLTFTVPIAQREFDPKSDDVSAVGDAVLLGASNHDKVRSGTGTKNEGMHAGDTLFNYEYGDNYTHIYDGADYREYWLSIASDGDIYAVWKEGAGKDPEEWDGASMSDMKGYSYAIGRAGYGRFYGAEDLLEGVYAWGLSANNNGDFWQQVGGSADARVYRYGFSYYNTPQYYCVISVEFTLNADYVLDYIRLQSYAYSRENFTVTATDDGNSKCELKENVSPTYVESIEYRQVTKKESPEEPDNPYAENSLVISSFDLIVDAQTLTDGTEGDVVELEADALYSFTVTNILPATANFSYDPVSVYWLKPDGTEFKCTYDIHNDDVLCYYNNGLKLFQFRSRYAGENVLLFRTNGGLEKKVVVKVNPIVPSALYVSAYEYNDTGYLWKNFTETGVQAASTVYVGQSLIFKAIVPNQEKTYADAGFEAILYDGEEGAATAETVEQDGAAIKFTATQAGTYTYVLRSTRNTRLRVLFTITVEEPPAVTDILSGAYTGKINYPSKGNVTVTFTDVSTAEVRTSEGIEILTLYYDTETGVLTSTHREGMNLGISLSLNEAYRIVLTNPTGFGSGTEKVILAAVEEESE